jgi:hypothetical protein
LHHIEYTRNPISSAILLFFWLFEIIVNSIKFRTRVIDHQFEYDAVVFGLFVITYILSITMFALECMGRPKGQYILLEEDEVST